MTMKELPVRKTSILVLTVLAALALGTAVWRGGGFLWTKLLEMHGIRKEPHLTPGASNASWPLTPAGTIAKGWVEAFSSGEETMREFRRQNTAAEVLAQRTEAERDAAYRGLKARFGNLTLHSIVSSTTDEIEVVLATSDGSAQDFTFTVEKEPPFKLLTVKMLEKHHFM